MQKTEDILFEFIKNVIYKPESAILDVNELPPEFQNLGEGLSFLGQCVREQKAFGKSLIKGDFEHNVPSIENGIAAPLKEVHGILKHLMWQSREVAKGDYNQKLDYFGELSDSFNSMVQQLKEREERLKRKNHELGNLLEMFKDITSDAPYYILILQRETGKVIYLNKSAQNIKENFAALYEKIYKNVLSCYSDEDVYFSDDSGVRTEHYQVMTTSHSKDEVCVYMVLNITDELEQKLKLENLVYLDELTGVKNRRYGRMVMQRLQNEKRRFAVAFVDLDHLKYCNDVFGHDSGDRYIKEVCDFLRQECVGTTVCRVGGDEFAVIKADTAAAELETQFEELSRKFIQTHQTPFLKSFSYGIAGCEGDDPDAISAALDEADRKMYRYKIEHKQKIQHNDDRI